MVKRACVRCLTVSDYICLKCGGCSECCKCSQLEQEESWVHVSSKEGSMKRNALIRQAVAKPEGFPTVGGIR